MSVIQLPLGGWRAKAPTKANALRDLMADKRWHPQQRMMTVAGMRFGARLFDLHNGPDPLHYQTERDPEDDSRVLYRKVDQVHLCDICSQAARMRPVERVKQLERQNADLRAEVDRLRRRVEDLEQDQPQRMLPDGSPV